MDMKEEFIYKMSGGVYSLSDVVDFAFDHLQNLRSLRENIKDFKIWVAS